MKKFLWILPLIGIIALWWLVPSRDEGPRYRTQEVQVGRVAVEVSATGTLQAVTRIDVGSEVSGRIESLPVAFNSVVKRGDVLARLDPATFQAQLEQSQASVSNATSSLNNAIADAGNASANVKAAEAAIKTAEARIDQSQAGVANAEAAVHQAQAAVAKARADLSVAARNSDRMTELATRDLVAQSEAEQARATGQGSQAGLDTALAQLEGARAGLASARTDVEAARIDLESAHIKRDAAAELHQASLARIEGARAQVQQANANLEQARINLERTVIRSPIDGIVLDVLVTEGQTVAAQLQAPSLFILAENLEQMQVQTSVDEADIGQVKLDAEASFTVDAFPEENFQGRVVEVRQSPVTVQNVVTYTVIVEASNPELRLKPGMTATVDILVDERTNALMVPNAALRFRPEEEEQKGPAVYTLQGRQPVRRPVQLGLSDGVNTELVATDLKLGEEVIVGLATPDATPSPAEPQRRRRGMRMF